MRIKRFNKFRYKIRRNQLKRTKFIEKILKITDSKQHQTRITFTCGSSENQESVLESLNTDSDQDSEASLKRLEGQNKGGDDVDSFQSDDSFYD